MMDMYTELFEYICQRYKEGFNNFYVSEFAEHVGAEIESKEHFENFNIDVNEIMMVIFNSGISSEYNGYLTDYYVNVAIFSWLRGRSLYEDSPEVFTEYEYVFEFSHDFKKMMGWVV